MFRTQAPWALLVAASFSSIPAAAQQGRMRVEVEVNDNGTTRKTSKDIDLADAEALKNALSGFGVVWDDLEVRNEGDRFELELRKYDEDDNVLGDMKLALLMNAVPTGRPVAYLGIYGGNYNKTCADDGADRKKPPFENGACITQVIEDTPAEKAGLRPGDVITDMDQTVVNGFNELVELIRLHEPGDKVQLTYFREGKKNSTNALLAQNPDASAAYAPEDFNLPMDIPKMYWGGGSWYMEEDEAFLGVEPTEDQNQDRDGVELGGIVEGSAAEKMGLRAKDVLLELDGQEVMEFDDLADLLNERDPGDEVTIRYRRNGEEAEVKGELGKRSSRGARAIAPIPPTEPSDVTLPWDAEERAHFRNDVRMEMEELRMEMDRLRQELSGELSSLSASASSNALREEWRMLLKSKGVGNLELPLDLDDFRCSPDRGSGLFRMGFDIPNKEPLAIDVYDARGQRVRSQSLTGVGHFEQTIDLTDDSDGDYFLVITQGGRSYVQKVTKR
jgi:membrane-associated protease RseP (regulator of RpoE activity)